MDQDRQENPDQWKVDLANEMTRNVLNRFPRRKMFAKKANELWAIDLLDYSKKYITVNRKFRYALIVIDVFSRFAWSFPMKRKDAITSANAFKSILEQARVKPTLIVADKGSEFYNKNFKQVLTDNGITLYSTHQDVKSAVVERLIRTIRRLVRKHFIISNSNVWYSALPPIIDKYNHKYHRSIKMTPSQAQQEKNHDAVYATQFPNQNKEQIPIKYPKFLTGDQVRISRKKMTFKKEADIGWSEEVFIIKEYVPSIPPVYKLKDLLDRELEGTFYTEQLLPTNQKLFRIDKTLRKRIKNGKRQEYVSWHGYQPAFRSWINSADVQTIK